jgi:hypothetical protein
MAWSISKQEFLTQGRFYTIYPSLRINVVELSDGTLINSANENFRVAADSSVLEWYRGPLTAPLEDCLCVSNIHSIQQTSLYKFFWTECYKRPGEIQVAICLQDLEPVMENGLPFDPSQIVEDFHRRHSGEAGAAK